MSAVAKAPCFFYLFIFSSCAPLVTWTAAVRCVTWTAVLCSFLFRGLELMPVIMIVATTSAAAVVSCLAASSVSRNSHRAFVALSCECTSRGTSSLLTHSDLPTDPSARNFWIVTNGKLFASSTKKCGSSPGAIGWARKV